MDTRLVMSLFTCGATDREKHSGPVRPLTLGDGDGGSTEKRVAAIDISYVDIDDADSDKATE